MKDEKYYEDLVMAHRYLYYVLAEPVISDWSYDEIERKAREILPESSPVQGVGSGLPGSYSNEQVKLAESFLQ
jgi:NAD-dependent DNA ligase